MADRGVTDWTAVEAEYRAGVRAVRQIARRHGVSDTAIHKRAKADGWVRATANRAEEAERLPAVPAQVVIPPRAARPAAPVAAEGDDATLALARDLVHRHLGELDVATSCQDEIEAAIYEETREDADGQRRAMMLRAVSLPARAATMKTLAQAMAILKDVGAGAEKGKKQTRQENAEKSASGRFAPPAPPRLVVSNGG